MDGKRVAIVAAAALGLGCDTSRESQLETTTQAELPAGSEPASDDPPVLRPACTLKMTAPEALQWTTYWDPAGSVGDSIGPSYVRSTYWGDADEREAMSKSGTEPLSLTCSSKDGTAIGVTLAAVGSTEADVPLAAGEYPIVPPSADGKMKPGELVAKLTFGGIGRFDAKGGTLTLARFDMRGAAGSFTLDASELLAGTRAMHIEGTFDIPCHGTRLEAACQATPAAP